MVFEILIFIKLVKGVVIVIEMIDKIGAFVNRKALGIGGKGANLVSASVRQYGGYFFVCADIKPSVKVGEAGKAVFKGIVMRRAVFVIKTA